MEVEEIQTPACKLPRIDNGRSKDHYPDEEDEHRDSSLKRPSSSAAVSVAAPPGGDNRLRGWHHSSRIIRVSRASGGKDRHSKVLTSKGLRDRRVRLSVTTAIQFYDLQDRLGYDQPSKAVEWLIKAAADSIAELPSLNNSSFPDTPKQLSDEKRGSEERGGFDSVELDGNDATGGGYQSQKLSKSACSSNSETSKGSGLSLSRSEQRNNRDKARARARVRAKEKEKEIDSSSQQHHHQNVNHISQNSSFTELLTGGIGSGTGTGTTTVNNSATSPTGGGSPVNNGIFHQKTTGRSWSTTTTQMDYFNIGLLGPSSSRGQHHSFNSLAQTMPISIPSPFTTSNENHHHHHQEMQHFSFVPDHMIPVTSTQQGGLGGDDDNNSNTNNLNFSISSGFNRGTLQSNTSTPPPPSYLQRFTHSSIDGPTLPFYIPPPVDHHHHHHHQHQFPAGFDPRLHLYYGDGNRNSDHKGKPKN